MRPLRALERRRLSQSFSRRSTWEKETSSSPEEARAAARFSRSALGERMTAPWPTKAVRSKTSRETPKRVSPQVSPVREGTASPVAV